MEILNLAIKRDPPPREVGNPVLQVVSFGTQRCAVVEEVGDIGTAWATFNVWTGPMDDDTGSLDWSFPLTRVHQFVSRAAACDYARSFVDAC